MDGVVALAINGTGVSPDTFAELLQAENNNIEIIKIIDWIRTTLDDVVLIVSLGFSVLFVSINYNAIWQLSNCKPEPTVVN